MPLLSHRHPSSRPGRPPRALTLAWGIAIALGAVGSAQAQSLKELYDAARGYDAGYLSARATLDAAQYRLDQT